jgi:hypothetical protein
MDKRTIVPILSNFRHFSMLLQFILKVFKTRAIFRARRRSRSFRNGASVLKTSYPRILYAIFFIGTL